MLHGQTQYNPPSRFLDEIPNELVTEAEGSYRSTLMSENRNFLKERLPDLSGFKDSQEPSGRVFGRRSDRPERLGQTTLTGAHLLGLKSGDQVTHRTWGEGVVISIRGEGERAEAMVKFTSVGEKRLLLALSPISHS
tara:strand:- start:1315 stop:1725 length:411 start_codon:yes stop_codon:yes gene_type:complete